MKTNRGRLRFVAGVATGLTLLTILSGCGRSDQVQKLTQAAWQAERRGQHDTAIDQWSEVVKLDRKNRIAYLQRARIYEVIGKADAAIADYTSYLALPPWRGDLRQQLMAKAGLRTPVDDTNWRADAHCRRGYLYSKKGDVNRATADLQEAMKLKPGAPEPYLWSAEIQERSGKIEAAEDLYDKAVRLAPQEPEARNFRAGFYIRRGKMEQALSDLEAGLRVSPGDPRLLSTRALARERHGKMDEALEDLDEAIQSSPNSPDLYSRRAGIYLQLGEYYNAFDDLEQVVRLRPNDPFALSQRGLGWARKGNVAAALADLEKAVEMNPTEPWFYAWRGSTLAKTNQFDKALADLDHAIELTPSQSDFYTMKGFILGRAHQYAKSGDAFKKALELNPGSAEAYNNLAWLFATCMEDSVRDGAQAVKLGSKACELTGYNVANTLDTLAAAYAETGDFDKALQYQNKTLEVLPPKDRRKKAMEARLALYQKREKYRDNQQGEE